MGRFKQIVTAIAERRTQAALDELVDGNTVSWNWINGDPKVQPRWQPPGREENE